MPTQTTEFPMSLRTLFALFTLTTLSTLATACDDKGDCAYGPTELRDVPLTAVAGEPIEAFTMFPRRASGRSTSCPPTRRPRRWR
jgi:hypothetical protein